MGGSPASARGGRRAPVSVAAHRTVPAARSTELQQGNERNGAGPEPDPVIEFYKRDVDRTLIREQLRRSVDERVRNMIAALRFAEALREAGRRRTP